MAFAQPLPFVPVAVIGKEGKPPLSPLTTTTKTTASLNSNSKSSCFTNTKKNKKRKKMLPGQKRVGYTAFSTQQERQNIFIKKGNEKGAHKKAKKMYKNRESKNNHLEEDGSGIY